MWLSEKERWLLTALGTLALLALGVLAWQMPRSVIRVEPGPSPPYAEWDARLRDAKQVDLNRAAVAELKRLPGIGPVLAQRILDYRQQHGSFRRPEELRDVSGIGPKTYEALRDYVVIE
jgi:competence protein ComEA